MKLLITGVSGQLGSHIINLSKHENYGMYLDGKIKITDKNSLKVDITDRNNVFKTVKKIEPDWVIHCAAVTNVDWCETNKEQTYNINTLGTKNLVDVSKEVNSKFLYISTDYVFDGKSGNYKETDRTNPINYYGKTKLDGELYVKTLEHYLIMRTALLYSPIPDNFLIWTLNKLKSGNIDCAYDMITSPTLALELAEAILKAIEKDLGGIYHSVGNEQISKCDFVKKIAEVFGYENVEINPIKMDEVNFVAKRPLNTSLNISKILSEGIKFSDVYGALRKVKNQMGL